MRYCTDLCVCGVKPVGRKDSFSTVRCWHLPFNLFSNFRTPRNEQFRPSPPDLICFRTFGPLETSSFVQSTTTVKIRKRVVGKDKMNTDGTGSACPRLELPATSGRRYLYCGYAAMGSSPRRSGTASASRACVYPYSWSSVTFSRESEVKNGANGLPTEQMTSSSRSV